MTIELKKFYVSYTAVEEVLAYDEKHALSVVASSADYNLDRRRLMRKFNKRVLEPGDPQMPRVYPAAPDMHRQPTPQYSPKPIHECSDDEIAALLHKLIAVLKRGS